MWHDAIPSQPSEIILEERDYLRMTERALLGTLSANELCRAKKLDYDRVDKMVKKAPETTKAWLRLVSMSGGTGAEADHCSCLWRFMSALRIHRTTRSSLIAWSSHWSIIIRSDSRQVPCGMRKRSVFQ